MMKTFRSARWLRLLLVVATAASALFIGTPLVTAQDSSSAVITVDRNDLSGIALSADNQMVAVNGESAGTVLVIENYDQPRPNAIRIGAVPGANDAEGITWIGTDSGANVYMIASENTEGYTSEAFIISVRKTGSSYSLKQLAGPLPLFTNVVGQDGVSSLELNDGAEGIAYSGTRYERDQVYLYSVREGTGLRSTPALFSHTLVVPGLAQRSPRWEQAKMNTTLRRADLGLADATDVAYNAASRELWVTSEEAGNKVVKFYLNGTPKPGELTSGIAEMTELRSLTFPPRDASPSADVYLGGLRSELVRWRFDDNAPTTSLPMVVGSVADVITIGSPVCTSGQGALTFTIKNNDSVKHRYYYKAGPPHGWDVEVRPGQTVTRTLRGIAAGEQQVYVARDSVENIIQRFPNQTFCEPTPQQFTITAPTCANKSGSLEFTIRNDDSRSHRFYVKAAPPHGTDTVVAAKGVAKLRLDGIPNGKQRVYVAQDSPTNIVFEFPQQTFNCS